MRTETTPVHLAWAGDRRSFRTWDEAGKLGRMWRALAGEHLELS